jgi:dipeptidyl-peptidase-4
MNAEGTQIIKYSFKTGKQVEVLFDAATARECPFKTFDSYSFSPDGSKLLIATEQTPIYRRSYTAIHYIYSLKRNVNGEINNIVEKLSDGGPQQAPVFSPDGTMVAFVRDNNIYLVKFLYGNSESQVTEDGKRNAILNVFPTGYMKKNSLSTVLWSSVPTARCWLISALTRRKYPLTASRFCRKQSPYHSF